MGQGVKQWGVWLLSVALAVSCWLGMENPLRAEMSMEQNPWVIGPGVDYAIAASPLQDAPIELTIHLGTAAGELKFVPDDITLDAGKRYTFVLDNPSPQKHYFTAKDFADSIWSQKVEAGQVEVKGAIHELELKPDASAEWVFVPLKPGTYELHCSISGHADAGMVGQITVLDR